MSRMGSGLRKSLVVVGVLALLVPLLLAWAAPVSAATITVCASGCDYTTIQAAVNAAHGGDVIHVYPGTYNESVNLSLMNPQGDLTLATVNATGVPTPGTAEVHHLGPEAEIRTATGFAFDGDLIIDGFVVYSDGPGIDVEVESAGSVDRNLVIRNVTATSTGNNGIQAEADGDVTITDCEANNNTTTGGYGIRVKDTEGNVTILNSEASGNAVTGIWVSNVDGTVTIRNCTANSNTGTNSADGGIVVRYARSTVSITNCTANGNTRVGFFGDSLSGALQISSCVFAGNEVGVLFHELLEADQVLVKGSIICGNSSYGLNEDETAATDAQGNWWGCAAGPNDPGGACDAVSPGPPFVDFDRWIDTVTASAPASAMAGEPAPVTFQFSNSAQTVFLGQGPGDLHGDPTFTVSTDNGSVMDPGFINEPHGVLAATLIPASGGTATVTLDGPCGLDAVVALGTWEFVPEPGSVLLLGSGLVGLAGYAGLRLRKR